MQGSATLRGVVRNGAGGALLLVLLAGGMLVLGAWYTECSRFLPHCLLHEATGLHCSGCGAQRAVHALLQGDVRAALGYNALLVLVLPFLLYAGVRSAGEGWFGWTLPRLPIRAKVVWACLALILLFTVARNVPVDPFQRLAP